MSNKLRWEERHTNQFAAYDENGAIVGHVMYNRLYGQWEASINHKVVATSYWKEECLVAVEKRVG